MATPPGFDPAPRSSPSACPEKMSKMGPLRLHRPAIKKKRSGGVQEKARARDELAVKAKRIFDRLDEGADGLLDKLELKVGKKKT